MLLLCESSHGHQVDGLSCVIHDEKSCELRVFPSVHRCRFTKHIKELQLWLRYELVISYIDYANATFYLRAWFLKRFKRVARFRMQLRVTGWSKSAIQGSSVESKSTRMTSEGPGCGSRWRPRRLASSSSRRAGATSTSRTRTRASAPPSPALRLKNRRLSWHSMARRLRWLDHLPSRSVIW